jgi:hypothetical protein
LERGGHVQLSGTNTDTILIKIKRNFREVLTDLSNTSLEQYCQISIFDDHTSIKKLNLWLVKSQRIY